MRQWLSVRLPSPTKKTGDENSKHSVSSSSTLRFGWFLYVCQTTRQLTGDRYCCESAGVPTDEAVGLAVTVLHAWNCKYLVYS